MSPILSPGYARERFAGWFSGQRVLSGLVAVGRIISNSAEEELLQDLKACVGGPFSVDDFCSSDQSTLKGLEQDFLQIVRHDMSRVSVTARSRMIVEAGSGLELPWHSDMVSFVRWNVSIGEAGTEGAKGQVCKADFDNDRLEVMLDEGLLIPETFPAGTVLRFMAGDIHRSPAEGTNRIFLSSTVSAAAYQARPHFEV
ncbi:MAG TPA: hypothetical protein VLG92_02450 [Candidatus Saccharimonadia bacterium]|nr:hypothetical protein [Candidatus Saccharimonadia bacterium]